MKCAPVSVTWLMSSHQRCCNVLGSSQVGHDPGEKSFWFQHSSPSNFNYLPLLLLPSIPPNNLSPASAGTGVTRQYITVQHEISHVTEDRTQYGQNNQHERKVQTVVGKTQRMFCSGKKISSFVIVVVDFVDDTGASP